MNEKDRELLEKLFKKNQKLKEDFGYLLEIWWKVPEERVILSDLKANHASGLATLLFVGVGGLGLIGTLLLVLGMSALGIGFLLGTLALLIMAVMQQSNANSLKKIAEEEMENYKLAMKNKVQIEGHLKKTSKTMKHDVVNQFEKSLSLAQDMADFRESAGALIVQIESAKKEIEHIYFKHKRFDFKLFEQEEVKAFSKVDAYATYDQEMNFWSNALTQAGSIRKLAANNQEDEFVIEVNNLISQFKQ